MEELRGRIAWVGGEVEEARLRLVAALGLARRAGAPRTQARGVGNLLRLAGSQGLRSEDSVAEYLGPIRPLLAENADLPELRESLVAAAATILERAGPEPLLPILDWLDRTESVPGELLTPLRLAAEVLSGRRPRRLPGERAEVRRAVEEVLRAIGEAGDTGGEPDPEARRQKTRPRKD